MDWRSDVENEGNPMVMGFQDEIDDEDYLRPSQLSYPVTQISDSSEDELQIRPPSRTATAYTVTQTLEDLNVEDNLDDWLNESSEQSSSSKQNSALATASASVLKNDEVVPAVSRLNVETTALENSAEEEVTSKSNKKTKEKKSKRKSKKSSKETGRSSNSVTVESDATEQPRPKEEYEEI